MLLAHNKFC